MSVRKKTKRRFTFFAVFYLLIIKPCNAQGGLPLADPNTVKSLTQASSQIVNELVQIFARSPQPTQRLNVENNIDFRNILKSFNTDETNTARSIRRFPRPVESADVEQQQKWSILAKEVLNIFGITTTPPPTTTAPTLVQRLANLVPEFLNPFALSKDDQNTGTITQTPFPTFTTLPLLFSTITVKPKKEDNIFDRVSSLFESNPTNQGAQIDTGRNFDKFIVRQNINAGDPITDLLGGKFNERGVEWNNGNLRFVNKKGSKLFGSEVAVHDRSVDIPVEQWFNFANHLVNDASGDRQK